MTGEEKKLLDNVLDGLDRLFDSESRAVDTYALIFATSEALSDTEYFPILNETSENLEKIWRSDMNPIDERFEALSVTDNLRIFLAKILDD